jgi:hypothetical protein
MSLVGGGTATIAIQRWSLRRVLLTLAAVGGALAAMALIARQPAQDVCCDGLLCASVRALWHMGWAYKAMAA